jgi:hypothetical protein
LHKKIFKNNQKAKSSHLQRNDYWTDSFSTARVSRMELNNILKGWRESNYHARITYSAKNNFKE